MLTVAVERCRLAAAPVELVRLVVPSTEIGLCVDGVCFSRLVMARLRRLLRLRRLRRLAKLQRLMKMTRSELLAAIRTNQRPSCQLGKGVFTGSYTPKHMTSRALRDASVMTHDAAHIPHAFGHPAKPAGLIH